MTRKGKCQAYGRRTLIWVRVVAAHVADSGEGGGKMQGQGLSVNFGGEERNWTVERNATNIIVHVQRCVPLSDNGATQRRG